MLLGKELESKNLYDVYYFENAVGLDKYSKESFIQARDKSLEENKTMVIMVDEVHQNPNACAWTYLLKDATGIIVIGVGIPYLNLTSPQFIDKYPPAEMYFNCNSEDMKELIDLFVKQTMGRDISPDDIAAICHYICHYTSGHMFPMLKFCEHIFDPAQSDHLGDYGKYLTSKAFYDHKDFVGVRKRCFSKPPFDPIYKILHGGVLLDINTNVLDQLGYWNVEKEWFISNCFIDIIFNTVIKGKRNIVSDVSFYNLPVEDKIEKIITTGLTHMTPTDFEEPLDPNLEKYEDAIGFCWGWNIKTYLTQLHIASQVQIPGDNKTGKNPCIDFVCNGENDIGFELIRNGTAAMCKDHADRFKNKYKRWRESGVILNFIISGDESVEKLYESPTIPIFHYLKETNTLYKGKKIFKHGVSQHISTPPISTTPSKRKFVESSII
jgi:hypothetical protein